MDEQLLEMLFPVFGADISTEFELQPAQTTPLALNVRAFEAATQRARGGSRPGIGQYIGSTVNGPHLIQLLDIVVDPSEPALFAASDPYQDLPDPFSIDDPSTSNKTNRGTGRRVRRGGNGIQPNRHYPSPGQQQDAANWFVGTTLGTTLGGYSVQLLVGGTVTGIPVTGSPQIPTGTTILLVKRQGAYYIQPSVYGS